MLKKFEKNKFRRRNKKEKKQTKEVQTNEPESSFKKSMLLNSAIITVRNPSKRVKALCKYFRKILSPDCLTKLEANPKIQDLLYVSQQLLIKHIIYISELEITIASLPNGPTYLFKIIDFEDNFKNYSNDIYNNPPFLTFNGKSNIKPLFQQFGVTDKSSKRALHFHFDDSLIYIRHYLISDRDTDDNFVVRLEEIGPKITLKLIETNNGVFTHLGLKNKRRYDQ